MILASAWLKYIDHHIITFVHHLLLYNLRRLPDSKERAEEYSELRKHFAVLHVFFALPAPFLWAAHPLCSTACNVHLSWTPFVQYKTVTEKQMLLYWLQILFCSLSTTVSYRLDKVEHSGTFHWCLLNMHWQR